MLSNIKPEIIPIEEKKGFIKDISKEISERAYNPSVLLDYPVVYIHNWESSTRNSEKKYDVYVGETNDIIERTKEHYKEADDPTSWQYHLKHNDGIPRMFIIGHQHFNKSLTLDIENRLMHYMTSMDNVHIVNGRGNPQSQYYPSEEFDDIFRSIWKKLRKIDSNLFLSESEIKDSALFKASPLHKLTREQLEAKNLIIERVYNALNKNLTNQLIFVNGEAGTGKTVLNSATFYELLERAQEERKELKCVLMVNHNEQEKVYRDISSKLGLIDVFGDKIVCKPTTFINRYSKDNMIDVAFVDEAHLLLTQTSRAYHGNNQLDDIMERAKVTIVMFDENQVLSTEQFWEAKILEKFINVAKKQNNYITLTNQLRMQCSDSTKRWIDDFTKNQIVGNLTKDPTYEIKIFDSPSELHQAIKEKANNEESRLSRIVASFDWEYMSTDNPTIWCVNIGDWSLPWNNELANKKGNIYKPNKNLSWAEQKHTINECGSTFTIQGFDLSYAGVILGPSVRYEDGKIVFHPESYKYQKAINNRTLSDGSKQKFGEQLVKNEIRVLLTRGVKGLYLYVCDEALREKIREVINNE